MKEKNKARKNFKSYPAEKKVLIEKFKRLLIAKTTYNSANFFVPNTNITLAIGMSAVQISATSENFCRNFSLSFENDLNSNTLFASVKRCGVNTAFMFS